MRVLEKYGKSVGGNAIESFKVYGSFRVIQLGVSKCMRV